jgi:hypothetical protein
VQLAFFGFFMTVALSFDLKLKRYPIPRCHAPDIPWRKHLNMLYITSALIMIRSVFRVIEYIQGNSGYLLQHEVYLYIFDASLMLITMAIFNIVHPSEIGRLLLAKSVYDSTELLPGSGTY